MAHEDERNSMIAKDIRSVLSRHLNSHQPLSQNPSVAVEMRLSPTYRGGLALMVLSVMPDNEKYMAEDMQSRSYIGILEGIRAIAPGLPQRVYRQDVIEKVREVMMQPITIKLSPWAIYSFAKAFFPSAFCFESACDDLAELHQTIGTKNPDLTPETLISTTRTIGRMMKDVYDIVGMENR